MINLETDMEGKQMQFGYAQNTLNKSGFCLGGGWEYDSGIFDGVLNREGGRNHLSSLTFSCG